MKLKKIIFYFPNYSRGGIEKTSLLLANYFLSKGLVIKFISFKKINNHFFNEKKNIKFYFSKKKSDIFFIKNFFCIKKLFQILIKENRNDTIIFSLQNSVLSIILSKLLNYKVVARNSAPIDYFKYKKNIFDNVILYLKMQIYAFSDLIISNSNSSAKKIGNYISNNKIIAIPNPIKLPQNKITKLKKKQLLYVGRLSEEKGVFQLIDGFEKFNKKNNNYILNIIGAGSQKRKLIEYIDSKKLHKKIIIKNWSDNIKKYYKNSKILILPSFFEGFGNVLIEALSYGLPCLSTFTDGPKEILSFGKFGLLIKDNSPESICYGISKIINNYKKYQVKAKQGFLKNKRYDISRIGKKYLNKIASII